MDQDWFEAGLPFMKMHGLGNDFVVVDARGKSNPINAGVAGAVGHRRLGAGLDQLVVILDSEVADARPEFRNSDGRLSDTCGNTNRCIAGHLIAATNASKLVLQTGRGLLAGENAGDGLSRVNVDGGVLETDWRGDGVWMVGPTAHVFDGVFARDFPDRLK